jgi:drug/metabolite transporter (DMT)-like permease
VTSLALTLVSVAAVLHATWNALTKRAEDGFLFLWSSMALSGVAFLPLAARFDLGAALSPRALPLVIATSVLHAAYFVVLSRAYRFGAFSLVYPVARGLGVALVPVAAFLLFDERMSGLGIGGVLLVGAGIAFTGWSASGAETGAGAGAGKGAVWAVATGGSIAAYSLVDAAGARAMHPIAYVCLMALGSVVLLLPVVLRRRAALFAEWRRSGRFIVLAASMNLTGYVLVLFAYREAKTGYVVAARELSIVLSAVVGSVLFREGRLVPRMLAASVILAGVGCVAMAR